MARFSGVRLTDLLTAMSLAVDLGIGQPMGHVARSCLLAQQLAALAELGDEQREHLCYVTLMGWLGCIADSHAMAAGFGDDIDHRAGVYDLDMRPLPFLGYLLRRVAPDEPVVRRMGHGAALIATGARGAQESLLSHCQVTEQIARRLGLADEVCTALRHVFARWDGKGLPKEVNGAGIAMTIRLWHVADVAEVHHSRGGVPAAREVVLARRGTQFDPELADLFCSHAERLLGTVDDRGDTSWADLAVAEPGAARQLTADELDDALRTVADWVDLKSPYFTGHSQAVAQLAAAAARTRGLTGEKVQLAHRAGLLHDLGRIGVSNAIWDKATPLTAAETERIRLHSYYTERMLTDPPALARIGAVAGAAHERLDGSGYHRGRSGSELPQTARILAAAECYHTALEQRPHRPARTTDQATTRLRREAADGRLEPAAVDAVLTAAGQRPNGPPVWPSGLTRREVEVLALLARGHTNRQIGRSLGISPKTAGNHIEHIYTKTGVGTRSAATLFAMQHSLT